MHYLASMLEVGLWWEICFGLMTLFLWLLPQNTAAVTIVYSLIVLCNVNTIPLWSSITTFCATPLTHFPVWQTKCQILGNVCVWYFSMILFLEISYWFYCLPSRVELYCIKLIQNFTERHIVSWWETDKLYFNYISLFWNFVKM